MLHSFTRNHNDLSTEAGFQFEFFCDCCGNGFKSTFVESTTYEKKKKTERFGGFSSMLGGLMNNRVGNLGYSLERGSNILGDRLNEQSPAWRKEHEAAFDNAQEEVRPMFKKCPACNKWVCYDCWNDEQGLCTECSPREASYVAQARARAMQRNIDEAADAAVVWQGKIETRTTVCPRCGKPAGTGKFCNECGAPLGTNRCPNCGGGEYLCEKKIKLAGNVFNPLPDGFSCDIMNIPDEAFKTLCEKILENKIDIESRFISLLFDMCIFSGCYFVAMSDGTEPSRFCYEILVKICKLLGQINLDIFVDIFTEGYKTDDCENYVRHSFYNLLAFELKQYIPFVEKAKLIGDNDNIPDIDVWLPLEDYTSRVEQFSSMMEHKTSAQFLHRIAVEYWKNNNDPELKKYINELQNRFNKNVKHKALQEYFYDTLVRIMTSGAALWKNDFLDELILCNVQDKNLLITYDNGVIKQMKRREDENLKYKESLSVISNLKKL